MMAPSKISELTSNINSSEDNSAHNVWDLRNNFFFFMWGKKWQLLPGYQKEDIKISDHLKIKNLHNKVNIFT